MNNEQGMMNDEGRWEGGIMNKEWWLPKYIF